jgi:hypothetical protein
MPRHKRVLLADDAALVPGNLDRAQGGKKIDGHRITSCPPCPPFFDRTDGARISQLEARCPRTGAVSGRSRYLARTAGMALFVASEVLGWGQASPIGRVTSSGMGSPCVAVFRAIPPTDNPLIPFGLSRATPRQSGPCCPFGAARSTPVLWGFPVAVPSTVHASPDGLFPGLVEGTVPKTGNTGAHHAKHRHPRRQHRSKA